MVVGGNMRLYTYLLEIPSGEYGFGICLIRAKNKKSSKKLLPKGSLTFPFVWKFKLSVLLFGYVSEKILLYETYLE
jgi:hypothetical protein